MFSLFKKPASPDPPESTPVSPVPDAVPGSALPSTSADDRFDVSALTEPLPAPGTSAAGFAPVVADETAMAELHQPIVDAISTVFDPEIPVNIFELGLVYAIRVGADRRVWIDMTLTSPNCPSAQSLPHEVQYKAKAVPGVSDAHVEIVWEPPWSMSLMTDAARLQLGLL